MASSRLIISRRALRTSSSGGTRAGYGQVGGRPGLRGLSDGGGGGEIDLVLTVVFFSSLLIGDPRLIGLCLSIILWLASVFFVFSEPKSCY